MLDLQLAARESLATLARSVPRVTAVLQPHGFVAEAAGADWAHWTKADDDKVVLRAYASSLHGGVISITITGGSMPGTVEDDLRDVLVKSTSETAAFA